MSNVYQFEASSLTGQPVPLTDFRGKVLLIVNTASECGFTPQYAGLQTLQDTYQTRGFDVLGFPCNQFGKQEPGDAGQIGAFCESRFHVTFPMFEKIDVNGADAHPLYKWLTSEKPGLLGTQAIKWNFTKFLLRRDGTIFKRYAPTTKPDEIRGDIETLLNDPGA
ncbi:MULTISPECIES: glutathione peroxidase [unclassified Cupriavidus]|jgi:glutathione peroxidase|uniref:glutathione peroxidase n=1 Tax=unclassified Cupriavidus TaxID=2640874 RepID=UPI001C0089B9|nr:MULTISPECIES: glutathione peroxidase [unclassified Cupriavidus]MCA3185828.1 glutathione peroxidase [Cupriavidus sp.]MCA3191154.1 glutathione peroxidase [Cupriavidus sp.]MCA3195212.1 glutathione peroxidase [Cupriavidus sp.]MCA3204182.1 glutathione peroxidase [Cupriavidus sp.]MCA3209633.1 glutathione peroxidase [Cupriavidus sp.]